MDKCPSCARPFTELVDFPIVKVLQFERYKLPAQPLPNHDRKVYVEPGHSGNPALLEPF